MAPRLYRMLLRLFPREFRGEFGAEMQEVFEAERAEARRHGGVMTRVGAMSRVGLWGRTIAGILRTAPREHASQAVQDGAYALRVLRRNPAFAFAAIVTLALGIGANTAIFSVVSAVLVKPLPFDDPDRLVRVWSANPDRGTAGFSMCPPDFREWRDRNRTLESIAAFYDDSFNVSGGTGSPEHLQAAKVSAALFPMLGVGPMVGRIFGAAEETFGRHRVAVLSYGLWQRGFGGDPAIAGRSVVLDSEPYTILGVMPQTFRFPSAEAELWMPMSFGPDDPMDTRGNYFLSVAGRLRPGVAIERSASELQGIAAQVAREHPQTHARSARVTPLREEVVGGVRPLLYMLLGAVALVLLIACANVANLLLARRASREKELAVRVGLGASRGRLVRQLLTESLVLSAAGGLCGLLLAAWGVSALRGMIPDDVPRLNDVRLDRGVLLFTIGLSFLTAFVFGVIPALHGTRVDLQSSLKTGGRAPSSGARRRVRASLVVVEVALALVLLSGAGLLIRSLAAVSRVDPGFRTGSLLTASVSLPALKYPKPVDAERLFGRLIERVRESPGVEAAAVVSGMPLEGERWNKMLTLADRPVPASLGDTPVTAYRLVSPGYFHTMGVRVVRGRTFAEADNSRAPGVAVINEATRDKYWPGGDPIGTTIWMGPPEHLLPGLPVDRHFPRLTIVGVVANEHLNGLDSPVVPEVYQSYRQTDEGPSARSIAVRARGDARAVIPDIRAALAFLDPDLPLAAIATLDQRLDEASVGRRFNTLLFGTFAVLAVSLAAVGIYGVIAYAVAERRSEMGIRLALGAARGDILRLIIGEGITLTGVGIAIGLAGAVVLTRWLGDLLFGVKPADPGTLGVVALLLAAVALVASYLPARRASLVDPSSALRAE